MQANFRLRYKYSVLVQGTAPASDFQESVEKLCCFTSLLCVLLEK